MKYPQLVSTRAVNAISDWLVSRLEQLGVEAPQIYTRLLLSLLQSSVINDPIEFSSLETFIVNRKGGGSIRRYLQFDANTLKKLNAIQCLSEIVSPEQELASIENLVDELWDKLKDIEKQNDRNNGIIDDTILIVDTTSSNSKTKANLTVQEATVYSPKKSANFCKHFKNDRASTLVAATANSNDVIAAATNNCEKEETDPKKRYFNAFPALSKEMEDSFRIWRRNAKSLTWPVNRGNNNLTTSNSTSSIMSSTFGSTSVADAATASAAASTTAVNDEKATMQETTTKNINETSIAANNNQIIEARKLTASHLSNFQNHVTSTNGIKRKTRRRKSQSMSKGRTMPNMRKNGNYNENFNATTFGGATANEMASGNMSRRQNRHLSPTQWDTDFDGYWEMGPDLIKEFFAKQDKRNRNRCNSEGSVTQHQQDENQLKTQAFEFNEFAMNCYNKTSPPPTTRTAALEETDDGNHSGGNETPQLMPLPQVDISFCYDETVDDDTYKSISELTADSLSHRTSPRRLYERLVLHENDDDNDKNVTNEMNNNNNIDALPNDNVQDQVQNDFMQYKAKFNSNIAALWQDANETEGKDTDEVIRNNFDESSSSLWSVPIDMPWPTVAPIKENLKNLWTIFNNHPLDFAKILQEQQKQHQQQQQHNEMLNLNSCASLPFEKNDDINENFISMPNNLETFEISQKPRQDAGGPNTPIGVFLQNSIWSENLNGGKNTDSDESFYLKVWNSNKKLYNLDAVYEAKLNDQSISDDSKITSSSSSASFQFSSSYGNPKWSEGINAGPNILQQQQQQHQHMQQQQPQRFVNQEKKNLNNFIDQNINSIDCVDASMSTTTASSSSSSYMLSSSGIFSGQTPNLQQQQQATLKNQSLTDSFGNNNNNNNGNNGTLCPPQQNENQFIERQLTETPTSPSHITLSNHSIQSSGFVDYKRIKTLTKSLGPDHIKHQQLNYQAQLPIIKDQPRYNDDENLLTSERTHFQPIRAYADGFAFDVCSARDVINYRRSESGYFYYESHKYLEYTRNDSFIDETNNNSCCSVGSGSGVIMSAAPLYAGSNCEAAVARERKREYEDDEELVLKFRIMNHDMSCQTDDEETIRQMYAAQNAAMKHPLYLIFSGTASNGMTITTTGQACSTAIEALNRAVAAAAQAAADRDRMHGMENSWLGLHDIVGGNSNNTQRNVADLWTTLQPEPREEIGGDEIDFCNESSTCSFGEQHHQQQQQWPIHNCSRMSGGGGCSQAFQRQQIHLNNNNNASNVNDLHSLWGMCAACNAEFKEAPPANHLLRDELNSEADEIMSDLKNMQDLYIGSGGFGNEENDDYGFDCGWPSSNDINGNIMHPMAIVANKTNITNDIVVSEHESWPTNGLELRQKETQQKVLQQVNKLIANLMRPEYTNETTTTTNILADTAVSAHRELGESLWPDDGEHNIWKNQKTETKNNNETMTKIEGTSGNNNNVFGAEEKQFLSQLTWEHDNLAELWARQTPTLTVAEATTAQNDSKAIKNNDNQKDAKNFIHNQEGAIDNTTKTTITNAANYKRIQQFLNSTNTTSNKLKLANRKRRHSASQNYAIITGNALFSTTEKQKSSNNNNNNNNNFKMSDLNNFNFKRNPPLISSSNSEATVATAAAPSTNLLNSSNALFSDDVDMESGLYDPSSFLIINNNNSHQNRDGGIDILPTKQTIITCKYWTTIDPMPDCSDSIDCVDDPTTTFSCLVDKNDSLLKHVTMLARPLTR